MNYVFDYEETLSRRITVHADNLADALQQLHKAIDDCTLVLTADDFMGAMVKMPLDYNPHTIRLEKYGESVEGTENLDIVIDEW